MLIIGLALHNNSKGTLSKETLFILNSEISESSLLHVSNLVILEHVVKSLNIYVHF